MNAAELTRNQKIVFTALEDAGGPLTAYQILALDPVRDSGLKAPLTIYRALDSLVQRGLAHRIESLNAFVVCSHHGPHPHTEAACFIICSGCRRTVELSAEPCEKPLQRQAKEAGFELDRIAIELHGRCELCRGSE